MSWKSLHGSFEAGDVDTTTFYEYFGKPYRIKVSHNGKGWFSGWQLNRVEITNLNLGGTYFFYCDCWLDGNSKIIDSSNPGICAWNNHYCWPGTCGYGIVKNCHCSQGFRLVSNEHETSCQLKVKDNPSIETCRTVAVGSNGEKKESKTDGTITSCENQRDFYGCFVPSKLQFDLTTVFSVNTSVFPTRPNYIDSENFGVSDVYIQVLLRRVSGAERQLLNSELLKDDSLSMNVTSVFKTKDNISISGTNISLQSGDRQRNSSAMLLAIVFQVLPLLRIVAATVCPEGYSVGGTRYCYHWYSAAATWHDARNICQRHHGDLVSLNDRDKFNFYRSLAQGHGARAWVGATDEHPWRWVNGQLLTFGWSPGEPNSGAENCVEIYKDKGYYLNDKECYTQLSFVCEIQACNAIQHCKSGQLHCRTGTDSVCNLCDDPFFGPHCQPCSIIDHCDDRFCTTSSDVKCRHCENNRFFFKPSPDQRHCDRMCAWNNHYCWPGTCGDGIVKNCQCSEDFRLVSNEHETSCQFSLNPSIGTCRTVAVGSKGEKKDSKTLGNTTSCENQRDFYGRFIPSIFQYSITTDFSVRTSLFPVRPNFIDSENFGVSDVNILTLFRGVNGTERQLLNNELLKDTTLSRNVKAVFSREDNITIRNISLNSGDSLCLKYIAYGGGFLISVDTSQSSLPRSKPKPYLKTSTTKTICYYYDDTPPEHCKEKGTCLSDPLHLETRISTTPNIRVSWQGWTDPIPQGGQHIHASKIESYQITVNEVSGSNNSLQVSTKIIYTKKLNASETSLILNISHGQPKLFCVTLEVKDVADNVKQARRFFLYDNTTVITSRSDKPFFVSSASKDTNYTWQTHHNDICIQWKDHFYNQFYLDNPLLNRIEPDPFGFISGVYEQNTGILPVSGTPNVYGITQFIFSYALGNGTMSTDSEVPNFQRQELCKHLNVTDGETYRLKIEAVDIAAHNYSEERTVSIDRSVPHIENIHLVKDGYEKLFVHDQVDLSKMTLQFHAYDPHSGIETVEWFFGVSEYSGVLDNAAIGVIDLSKTNCSVQKQCYCPKVGNDCEIFQYTVDLNRLINKMKNVGNHNRNYYFTIKVTNKAKLVNIEHIEILVDDSPPETGVVLEGPTDYPDIDYTSDRSFLVNWHGFIDHESGIMMYRIGLASRCLTKEELYQKSSNISDVLFDEVPYSESSIKLPANFTGKRFVSVIALNNAMDPSNAICSDGISRDTATPQLRNITIANAKWSESIYCVENATWFLRSDLVKVQLINTAACKHACRNEMQIPLLDSIRSKPKNNVDNVIASLQQNQSSPVINFIEESDFLCSNFPKYDSNIVYLPNDHIVLSWDVEDKISQIRDFFVGFGHTDSEQNAPGIVGYKSTGNKKYFKLHHVGIGTDNVFFIFLKAVNKAGLETVITVGPVLIDMTPPRYRTIPEVKIVNDSVLLVWNNNTFFDDEQTETIHQIFFQIGHDGKPVTPLLEWRYDPSTPCPESTGECIRYPLSKLQRKDTDLGLNFQVTLHVYNNAGHSITLQTPKFVIRSKYPPGKAIVLDLDPVNIDPANINVDKLEDVNFHLTKDTVCMGWRGFRHDENLTIEIGVGTQIGLDDINTFSTINNSGYHCMTSNKLPLDSKVYVSLRATGSGGITTSSSNGVVIRDKTKLLLNFRVMNGPSCSEYSNVFQTNRNMTARNNTHSEINHTNFTLLVGHVYMLRLFGKNMSTLDASFLGSDVFVKKIRFDTFYTDIEFQPTEEDISPQCLTVNIPNNIKVAKLFICEEDSSSIVEGESMTVHWQGLSRDFTYEVAAIQRICSNDSNICFRYMSPFTSVRGYEATVSSLQLQPGSTYHSGVRPCLNGKCLDPVLSSEVHVEPKQISLDITKATAFKENGDCFNITLLFDQIFMVNVSFYQWSLANGIGSSKSLSLINRWKTLRNDQLGKSDAKVEYSVKLHGHDLKDVYACVRAFTAARQKFQTCKKIHQLSQPNAFQTTVYDFNARSKSWKKIKEAMHSLYLGDLLNELHNEELDFGTEDTDVVGILLYANNRNISWFLTTVRTVPDNCNDIDICRETFSTTTGYAEFSKKYLKHNTIYYICAVANASHIVRETFTEILQPIQSCSNGFVIDSIPPVPGHVYVRNVNGFISDLKQLVISWNGFDDNIDAKALGYDDSINGYSVEVGSTPNGNNLRKITGLLDKKSVVVDDLQVPSGSTMFVSVIARDHAGLSTRVTTKELFIDTSPPSVGRISSDTLLASEWISDGLLSLHLLDFKDSESGLDFFLVHVGSSPFKADTMVERIFRSDVIELDLNAQTLFDGHFYYIGTKAVNRAGLSSAYAFLKFGIDKSPPVGGHVLDGTSNNIKDVDFQTNVNYIASHWKGFTDPHSGVAYYTAGVGTDAVSFDTEPRINVGLRTEIVWNSTFTPGEKYFITVEACNKARLCRVLTSDGIVLDDSPPIPGLVRIGSNSYHQSFIPNNSTVQFFWTGFEDPQSGIDHFESCIGTSPDHCDITPNFNCFLESSHIKVGLNLPESVDLYLKVTGYNKNGQQASKVSQPFRIDSTAPVILDKPKFFTNYSRIETTSAQWDKSVLRLQWQFEDKQSPIVRHTVTLSTHHEGHTPVQRIDLGQETKLTIRLEKKSWLQNGDTYRAIVTACNAAGLCSSAESDDLLVDSTPPHLGGFKPPMTWKNFEDGKHRVLSQVNLTWYGFHDQESGIRRFWVGVGRTYTENELTDGLVEIASVRDDNEHNATLTLNDSLGPDEKIVASIVAENYAGLKSPIGRITLMALASSSNGHHQTLNGILETEKHSCDVHFCNKDCTCAVVGKVCTEVQTNMTCKETISNKNVLVHVFGGMAEEPQNITASSACLAGHWYIEKGEELIKRFEWTLGIKNETYGSGIFELTNERPWMDVGKALNAIYCIPQNRSLEHGIEYSIYLKAWIEMDEFLIFESPPIMVDHYPPAIRRGGFVKDSNGSCTTDYDFIDWTEKMTACWQNVFNEGQGHIIYYIVGMGTQPGSDDIVANTDVRLNVTFEARDLNLLPGHKYYFTVTAYNNVGLHTAMHSDGFIVDKHPPVTGVVYNTYRYRNYEFASDKDSFGLSWQGFLDHDAGIFSYYVAVLDESNNDTLINFTDVALQTSMILTNLSLEHGKSYYGAVKAVDAAGHESKVIYSKRKLIDVTPPEAYICREKSIIYDLQFNTSDINYVILPVQLEAGVVYAITGVIKHTDRPLTMRFIVGQRVRKFLPLEKTHAGSVKFETSFSAIADESCNITLIVDSADPVDGTLALYRCDVSPILDTSRALTVRQITPNTFRARLDVQDLESGIKQVTFGLGTTSTGFQLKSPYQIDPNTEEIFILSVTHGTPIYATAITENFARLTAVFRSKMILADHTPPVFGNVSVKLESTNLTTDNQTFPFTQIRLEVSWNVTDDESGIQLCYVSLGSKAYLEDIQKQRLAIHGHVLMSDILLVSHGERIHATVKCINNVELSSVKTSEPLVVTVREPDADDAAVSFIPQSEYDILHSPVNREKRYIQSNRTHIVFFWEGFKDSSEIVSYEYRLLADNKQLTGWTNAGKKTLVAVDLSSLADGQNCTAEVRAVNAGNRKSEAIGSSILIDSREPKLTGHAAEFTYEGRTVTLNWRNVFELNPEIPYTFDVLIGSAKGYSDISEKQGTTALTHRFFVPRTSTITENIQELFVSVKSTYVTGMKSTYKTVYKLLV